MNNQIILPVSPIHTNHQSPKLTKMYKFLSTNKFLKPFFDKGFIVRQVIGTRGNEFGKHIVKLSHPDLVLDGGKRNIELCVLNSHDGSRRFKVFLGILEMACLNGIIAGQAIESATVKHVGSNFYNKVDAARVAVLDQVQGLKDTIYKLQNTTLTGADRLYIADIIYRDRLKTVKGLVSLDLETSIVPLRPEDYGTDAWTFLNILQERLIRGGIHYVSLQTTNDPDVTIHKNHVTRETKSVDNLIKLNQSIFDEFSKRWAS